MAKYKNYWIIRRNGIIIKTIPKSGGCVKIFASNPEEARYYKQLRRKQVVEEMKINDPEAYKQMRLKRSADKRQWAKRHPEKAKADALKQFYKNHERELERIRVWAKNNPEKVKINQKRFYDNNSDSRIKNAIDWQKKNPERVLSGKKRRYNNDPEKYITRSTNFARKQNEPTMTLKSDNRVRWTDEEIMFLKNHAEELTDMELAKIFDRSWMATRFARLLHTDVKRKQNGNNQYNKKKEKIKVI